MDAGDNRLENGRQRIRREETGRGGEIEKAYRRKIQVWD